MGDPELMSADDFLVWIETQNAPHELADGVRIRLTAGTPQSHNVVASNILVALVPRARRAGCRVTRGKTAVRTGLRGIRYPDVVVDCGPFDLSAREATGPVVVSSPRTSSIDVTDKLDEYRAHVGLRLILFVDPDVVAVKVYRRDPAGAWQVERYDDPDQAVDLREIGASLSLQDIYDTLSPRLSRTCESSEHGEVAPRAR